MSGFSPYVEEVRGEIIGEPTIHVQLVSCSSGNIQARGEVDHSSEARPWAMGIVAALKARLGEAEYRRVYPLGMDLRIYDV